MLEVLVHIQRQLFFFNVSNTAFLPERREKKNRKKKKKIIGYFISLNFKSVSLRLCYPSYRNHMLPSLVLEGFNLSFPMEQVLRASY